MGLFFSSSQLCPLDLTRTERREDTLVQVTVESANTESILEVGVMLVVNTITESISTSTILVTSERSVCVTTTRLRTSSSALPSTLIASGPLCLSNNALTPSRTNRTRFLLLRDQGWFLQGSGQGTSPRDACDREGQVLQLQGRTEDQGCWRMPDLLHVIPVGHDAVLNGVLQGEDTPLGL